MICDGLGFGEVEVVGVVGFWFWFVGVIVVGWCLSDRRESFAVIVS
jgi:hypothetical protein